MPPTHGCNLRIKDEVATSFGFDDDCQEMIEEFTSRGGNATGW